MSTSVVYISYEQNMVRPPTNLVLSSARTMRVNTVLTNLCLKGSLYSRICDENLHFNQVAENLLGNSLQAIPHESPK